MPRSSKTAARAAVVRDESIGTEPVVPRADNALLSLRIDLAAGQRIGPGKIELLEQIAGCGSISAAAREMHMSYLRAWELVDELDSIFGKKVVARRAGGRRGGYAKLTPLGNALVTRFRAVERAAAEVARDHLAALQTDIEQDDPAEDAA